MQVSASAWQACSHPVTRSGELTTQLYTLGSCFQEVNVQLPGCLLGQLRQLMSYDHRQKRQDNYFIPANLADLMFHPASGSSTCILFTPASKNLAISYLPGCHIPAWQQLHGLTPVLLKPCSAEPAQRSDGFRPREQAAPILRSSTSRSPVVKGYIHASVRLSARQSTFQTLTPSTHNKIRL